MHPHRSNALRYASAASAAHSRVYGGCAAEAAVSEASGPRVSGCTRAPRYFGPYPVLYFLVLLSAVWSVDGTVHTEQQLHAHGFSRVTCTKGQLP